MVGRLVGVWDMRMSYARIFVISTFLVRDIYIYMYVCITQYMLRVLTAWTTRPPPTHPYVLCGQIWLKPVLILLHNCFYTRYDSVHLPLVICLCFPSSLSLLLVVVVVIVVVVFLSSLLMKLCKAPTLRLKALNKHNITHNVHRDVKIL